MRTNWQGLKCFIGSAVQGPNGNQAASLKWVVEVEPLELFAFKEHQDLLRTRLTGPLLRLIPQLTGLRLHVLWHRPMDFHGPDERPVLCPQARQRAGANGRQPNPDIRCRGCLQRRWKPALHPANQGRRFIGQCGATNFCACLQVDKVCPLTLVLQARVAPRSPSSHTAGRGSGNAPATPVQSVSDSSFATPGSAAQCMIGIQEEFFPTHGLTAFGVHPSGCLPPVNTLKRGHQTRLEPVSAAAFHDAVALARLILHDLESTAQARMARSGLDNALRRLNNTQTEAMRLRRELRWRLPDSLATSCTYIRQVEDDTKAGKLWQWQEDILTTAEIVNEGLTHFNDLVYTGGSTMIDGTCVYSYTGGQPQLSINLSFGWVNTSSGQPTTTGPAVGSVAYYMWDGVDDPNIFPDSWPLLGTSTWPCRTTHRTISLPYPTRTATMPHGR